MEMIVGLLVLSLGIIPIVALIMNMRKGLENRNQEMIASTYAQSLFETMKSRKWDESVPSPGIYTATPSAIGPDAGETTLADFDDVDDFNGYVDTPESGFQRQVTVDYAAAGLNSAVGIIGTLTDFKYVQIEVKCGQQLGHTEVLQSVLANGMN